MKEASRFYPRVQVDTSVSGAVSQAGGALLTEVVTAGLGRELTAALGPWRKPLAVHDPAKVITDLAVTLALGGDCLADLALQRAEPASANTSRRSLRAPTAAYSSLESVAPGFRSHRPSEGP